MAKLTRRDLVRQGAALAAGALLDGCFHSRPAADLPRCPAWKPGELDIHFIHTGCGEQTFFIFPDGTTMLLDCGDTHHEKYMDEVPPMPSARRMGGEWVSRYIQRLIFKREIDYLMVSHWHGDHIGDPATGAKRLGDGREVVGITAVAEDFRFRDYFDHQYPCWGLYAQDPDQQAYELLRDWLPVARRRGMRIRHFEVGALNQIRLMHRPQDYPTFEIRNLAANAVIWNGKDGTVDCGAIHVMSKGAGTIPENRLSSAIRIRYGNFAYYTGGDNELTLTNAKGREYDWEQLIGKTCGPVDVCKTNHHAGVCGMSAGFVREVRPQVYLSSVWQAGMVDHKSLSTMCSRELYPGDRLVCFGHIADSRREVAQAYGDDIAPAGHTVVKVAAGGGTFSVYSISAEDETMRVIGRRDFVSRSRA